MLFPNRIPFKFIPVFTLVLCLIMPIGASCGPGRESSYRSLSHDIREYGFPSSIRLCGEVIDLEDPANREMFDREFTITVWDVPQVLMWLKRAGRFFPYFEDRLAEEGLPEDLKYLAVAESSLHTHIKSRAGALGIWQLMEETAQRNGLQVDRSMMDERFCYERSTDAALKYLKFLRETFKTWLLSMAAYNCGENRMNKALKNQNADNYFSLDLPRETERYVFRIAAIKLVMEHAEEYGFRIDESRVWKPLDLKKIQVDIKDRFYVSDISELTGIPYKKIMELNPKFLSPLLPVGSYSMHLPPDTEELFFAALEKLKDPVYIKKHSYTNKYYIVQPGDALSAIAWETGVSVRKLKKINHIRGSMIYPGQRLIIRE